MKINSTSEEHIQHVQVQGFLNEATFPLLQAELEGAVISRKTEIWIDCTYLTGITAEAIAYLTLYQYILQEKGSQILIINLAHHIQFLFNATQLDTTIPVFPSRDLAYFMHQNNSGSNIAV